jgi:excisionase family DNA binding protein
MSKQQVPRWLRAEDVARMLHVSPKTVGRWANEGKLAYVRTIGRHRRYDPDVVARLVEKLDRSDTVAP